jgi:hypothetical protein
MDAELVRPGQATRPLAGDAHGQLALEKRQEPCYSGLYGLFHTGTGPTSADGGNKGASCDSAVSTVQSERSVFTLNTSIIAVAEAALGRMGTQQLQRYTTDNAQVQLDPSVWEIPGDMPEISPSPDFGANIDKLFTERSSGLQAWGTYGILWPVVHHELGVSPDMGRDHVTVVPQVPDGQSELSGSHIRLGDGYVDVHAIKDTTLLRTTVDRQGLDRTRVTLGVVLPAGTSRDDITNVWLNSEAAPYEVVRTARGTEVLVDARPRYVNRNELQVELD